MSQPKERSRRNLRFRIAALAAVCLALFLTFPAWALADSSHETTPPDKTGVSDAPAYGYPDNTIPEDKRPHSDFYIMTPTIIPEHSHDTDGGKQVMLTVIVTDKITRQPLPGVRVEIQDPDRLGAPSITGSREELHMTDDSGKLQIALFPDPKKRYQISVHYLGYQPYQGRPFTVEASQEMRIELVPTVAVLSPPAIVTKPGIKVPGIPAIISPPHKGQKHGTSRNKNRGQAVTGETGEEVEAGEEDAVTQSAIENEPTAESDQPVWDYLGGSSEDDTGVVHWLILAGAAMTGLLGGLRLWRLHQQIEDLKFRNELKRR